jgi:hypothetical protein
VASYSSWKNCSASMRMGFFWKRGMGAVLSRKRFAVKAVCCIE